MVRVVAQALLLLPFWLCAACVKQTEAEIRWTSARFNERLRADLEPLEPRDRSADLDRGFFRDGSDGGLVSPLFPVAASRPHGAGHLVQTACLFVGEERDAAGRRVAADELRMSWEVAARIDRGVEPFDELFVEGREELGLCSFSNPESRLLFEDPARPIHSPASAICGWGQQSESGFSGALALNPDDWQSNRNIPIYCGVPLGFFDVAVDAFEAPAQDADARCPAEPPSAFATRLDERSAAGGAALRGDRFASCAWPPVGTVPTADTVYRLSLHADAPFGGSRAERWLRPAVLTVLGRRSIVRPFSPLPSGRFSWSTKVDPEFGEGPVRWEENFTPTVRVEQVEVVSRRAGDGSDERIERPASDRLVLTIPQPGGADAIVTCLGRVRDGSFGFAIDPATGNSDCSFELPSLRGLTPTYALSVLDLDPAVTRPIRWEVNLPSLSVGRELFIRFRLVARSLPAALKSKALHSFGRTPVGSAVHAALSLENVGGRPLEVQSVEWDASAPPPAELSFLLAGDPIAVPLPVGAARLEGGLAVRWGSDLESQDLLRLAEREGEFTLALGEPSPAEGPAPALFYGKQGAWEGGLLLRDERDLRFDLAPGGEARPFALPISARLAPPFLMQPGGRVTLAVTARPAASGSRAARIVARAVDPTQPSTPLTAVSTVSFEGVSGPQLHALPASIWVKRDAETPADEPSRWLEVSNVGASALTLSSWQLAGSGAGRFRLDADRGAPPWTLAPGESARLRVTYLPECDGEYALPDDVATVLFGSNGGGVSIPLFGMSGGYCGEP